MEIIAADKGRAIDGYVAASGDKRTAREMLLKIANDPDVAFTMTPRAMKSYAEFMHKTGSIKRLQRQHLRPCTGLVRVARRMHCRRA